MPHINLLPWRDEQRKRREKEFIITAVIAALLMGGVVLGVDLHYKSRIEFQNKRNGLIETEIAGLNKKIKEIEDLKKERDRLIARTKVIQNLQAGRPEIVHVFDQLVTTLPNGVYYTKMRSLDASTWFENPSLVEIKANPQKETAVRLSTFSLNVNQATQKKQSEEKEGSGG
jgi:type IV pilus assembly protein PilN